MSFDADTFTNLAGVEMAARRALAHLVPPPEMLPSVWAEANIRIPVGNAVPGPISFANAPYQRGMIDVVKEVGIRRVDYMTGAQLGKTTVQQCITGYFIAHEPRSQIFVQPTQGDVQTFLETKLRPMLDANPAISRKMSKQRGRDGVNNSRIISYLGGWLMFSWAGSPKTLRGRSAPITQADEVDGMVATPEGDPVELLAQRAATFGDQAINTRSSTPTIKGASRIEAGFLAGDQRRFYVPCPHCDHPQFLRWERITWTGRKSTGFDDADQDLHDEHDPLTAAYSCEECGADWDDGQRIAAIRQAEPKGHGWKAAKPFLGHASFHAPEWLSTFRRLREIVQSYLDKLRIGDLQSFMNVSAGETFEERGEQADPDALAARAEEYRAAVPAGAFVLTAGVDMQADRLEVEIVGWGQGEESWSIEHIVLWGDPDAQDVWDELEEVLASTWQHESGALLPLTAACVDTGGTGGNTQSAYDWLRGKTGRRIFAIKGRGGWGNPIVAAPSRKQSGKAARKVDLFLVGADEAKLTVMRRLAVQKPKNWTPGKVVPGYCHFPVGRDADYYQQLTAEKLITRYVKGFPVREWHKTRPRNEALDCRVYALAALKIANPSMRRAAARLGAPLPTLAREALDEQAGAEPANDNPETNDNAPPAEIPHEEKAPPQPQSGRVIKPRRVLKSRGGKGGNWATQY